MAEYTFQRAERTESISILFDESEFYLQGAYLFQNVVTVHGFLATIILVPFKCSACEVLCETQIIRYIFI